MKPENWTKWSSDKKTRWVDDFIRTPRCKYILSQALYVAREKMIKDELHKREVSDIQDMEMLLETYFAEYNMLSKSVKRINGQKESK
jgi:hypothetical protein